MPPRNPNRAQGGGGRAPRAPQPPAGGAQGQQGPHGILRPGAQAQGAPRTRRTTPPAPPAPVIQHFHFGTTPPANPAPTPMLAPQPQPTPAAPAATPAAPAATPTPAPAAAPAAPYVPAPAVSPSAGNGTTVETTTVVHSRADFPAMSNQHATNVVANQLGAQGPQVLGHPPAQPGIGAYLVGAGVMALLALAIWGLTALSGRENTAAPAVPIQSTSTAPAPNNTTSVVVVGMPAAPEPANAVTSVVTGGPDAISVGPNGTVVVDPQRVTATVPAGDVRAYWVFSAPLATQMQVDCVLEAAGVQHPQSLVLGPNIGARMCGWKAPPGSYSLYLRVGGTETPGSRVTVNVVP